jgi:outer membrane receptor for ferrienterochelin and colicin
MVLNEKRLLAFMLVSLFSFTVFATEKQQSIDDLDLDALLNQRVSLYRQSDTASGVNESVMDAPAAMVVLTKEDIRRRGYLSLDEILSDLPGFDTITTNGTVPSIAYQRGYRTPFTQRTLLLINGKVDNKLWSQTAVISKQYPIQAIERVEVLYGPAGAVYGPNAFLGVINVITRDPRTLKEKESYFKSQFIAGEFGTYGIDFTSAGALSGLNYVISGKFYESDGAKIKDYTNWGFFKDSLLNDQAIWGQAIATSDFNNDGIQDTFSGNTLGKYGDPTSDYSVIAELSADNFKVGAIYWLTDEAYGPFYALDKGQPNVSWLNESVQYYAEHSGTIEQVEVNTEILYREANVFGYWAENSAGWVSLSNWNSYNDAWRFRQQYSYQLSENLQISGGIKYEKKNLTKAYVVCGYWSGSICPADGGFSDGSSVKAPGERDTVPLPAQIIRDELSPQSSIGTVDRGVFIQGIYNWGKWRFNGGVRWDNNSEYGSVVIPRGAVIYHQSTDTTFKLIYGEAFQEPAPKDLYGGWSGRAANPNLKPETMSNIEFIAIHQAGNFMHDVSFYYSQFDQVIVNGTFGNVGGRDVFGIEYRGSMNFSNPLFAGEDITAKFYYTYTDAQADFQFIQGFNNDGSNAWVKKKDSLGDIAPHKISFIVDFPLNARWTINLQANWVSARTLYSENPLRAQYNYNRNTNDNRETDPYFTVDLNLRYHHKSFDTGIKIDNLFAETYWQPGVEGAGSGDDFSQGSLGFNNSLIPQVKVPVVTGYFTLRF